MATYWRAIVTYGGKSVISRGKKRWENFAYDVDGKDAARAWVETCLEYAWEFESDGIEYVIPASQVSLTEVKVYEEEIPEP